MLVCLNERKRRMRASVDRTYLTNEGGDPEGLSGAPRQVRLPKDHRGAAKQRDRLQSQSGLQTDERAWPALQGAHEKIPLLQG